MSQIMDGKSGRYLKQAATPAATRKGQKYCLICIYPARATVYGLMARLPYDQRFPWINGWENTWANTIWRSFRTIISIVSTRMPKCAGDVALIMKAS